MPSSIKVKEAEEGLTESYTKATIQNPNQLHTHTAESYTKAAILNPKPEVD
jgi:hypothetical protein